MQFLRKTWALPKVSVPPLSMMGVSNCIGGFVAFVTRRLFQPDTVSIKFTIRWTPRVTKPSVGELIPILGT